MVFKWVISGVDWGCDVAERAETGYCESGSDPL